MNSTHINFIGQGSGMPVKMNRFRKGSIKSTEDPLFLTFFMDFSPTTGDLSHESISFNSLLSDMGLDSKEPIDLNSVPSKLEISTLEYLQRAENTLLGASPNSSAQHLRTFQNILDNTYQSAPWFFQQVAGVGDLWKRATNTIEGTKKVSLTVTCLESVDMRIIQMADAYRKAIYNQKTLSYKVPDNLRYFSFDLYLFEIRNLKSFETFSKETSEFTDGNHYVKFKCKMCEFDFSETMNGGATATDMRAYTDDKPFGPTFKINVGWVEEDSVYQESVGIASDLAMPNFGIFNGAIDSLSNQVTRQITNLARIPARVIGSVINEVQTTVTGVSLGNAYSGQRDNLIDLTNVTRAIGSVYTPRTAPVGPNPGPTDLGKVGGY